MLEEALDLLDLQKEFRKRQESSKSLDAYIKEQRVDEQKPGNGDEAGQKKKG